MLREDLNQALKVAMKARDTLATRTLRLIVAALKDRDIAARSKGNSEGVNEEEILELLQKMVRQREEAIELYRQAGRAELVEKEEGEIAVIQRFLPQPLSAEDMQAAISETIDQMNAQTIKDMGKVMGALKERFPGRMDFGKASAEVKSRLA